MSRILQKQILLFVLALMLAIISFSLFRVFISQTKSTYAVEIAAAFVGTLLTIIITAILLKHQTDSELQKEKSVKIYETKVEAYKSLMEKIEEILLTDEIDDKAPIQLQIIFQKLAFVAGRDVLTSLKTFAKAFAEAAKDGTISKEERKKILSAFGELSVEIRDDLSDHHEHNREEIRQIIKENIESIPLKTTQDGFLEKCDELERPYFEKIIHYLQKQGITYVMGIKGMSVRDQNNKGVLHLFPTGTVRSIQFRTKEISAEKNFLLQERMKTYGVTSLSFKPSQVPADVLIEMLNIVMD